MAAAISFDFSGRTAIVTGAGSGIGAAIATELARSGACVIASDLDDQRLDAIVGAIRNHGGTAHGMAADVADWDAMAALVAFALEQGGQLDMAVNNAGISGPRAATGDYPKDGWQQVIDVNLNGVFYAMRHQIPAMLASGGGAIVNMASILGSVGLREASAYVAAKHAVVGLTKAAALEYAPAGIRVNAIGPGFIDTPLLHRDADQETLDQVGMLHALGRMGTVEEVSALACFLLSDRASFITGSYHLVDGGFTAQ